MNDIQKFVFFQTFLVAFAGIFFGDGDQWSEVKRFTLRFLGQVSNNRLEVVMQEEMSDWFKAVTSGQVHEVFRHFFIFRVFMQNFASDQMPYSIFHKFETYLARFQIVCLQHRFCNSEDSLARQMTNGKNQSQIMFYGRESVNEIYNFSASNIELIILA